MGNNIPSSLWIPVHRRLEAEQKLGEKLNLVDWEKIDSANFQENYDYLEKTLNSIKDKSKPTISSAYKQEI